MDTSRKFWDRQAASYDAEEMKDRQVRAAILEKTGRYLGKENSVLDVGCATGILVNEIAGKVRAVHGIDISPAMIDLARSRAGERGIQNATYTHATIFDEPLQAGSFDVILGIYLLHLLDDMAPVLRRIHALLKPGGLFISVTPCLGKTSVTGAALLLVSKLGLIPSLKLFSSTDLENAMAQSGFTMVETTCIQPRGRQYFIVAEKR